MVLQKILSSAVTVLLGLCLAGNAMAGWKEDQAAFFHQIPVKPGDRIDASNWEKVKDLLPPSVVDWVKKGDYILDIGEFRWDFNTDAKWRQASANNAGKYAIKPGGGLIEKSTGDYPEYVTASLFPRSTGNMIRMRG